jgi:two-component system response regulator PilR (NtrC family)
MVHQGSFRDDLYYRLNVVQIGLPALRERSDDLELLARHFIQRFSGEYSKRVTGMSPEVIRVLKLWQFPGNVRELQNVIERAVALSSGPLMELHDLPPRMREPQRPTSQEVESDDFPDEGVNLDALLAVLEKHWLVAALDAAQGNKTRAASMLQMSFRSFRYRLAKYDLDHEA